MAFADNHIKAIAGKHCTATRPTDTAADDDDFCIRGGDRHHVVLRYLHPLILLQTPLFPSPSAASAASAVHYLKKIQ